MYANDLEQQHTGWAHWMLLFLLRLWLFFFLFLFFILFFFPPFPSSFFPSVFLFILLFPSYVMKSNRKGKREPAFNKRHLCVRRCPWWYHMHNLIQSSDNASRKFLIFPSYRGRTQALLKSSELLSDTLRVSDSPEAVDYPVPPASLTASFSFQTKSCWSASCISWMTKSGLSTELHHHGNHQHYRITCLGCAVVTCQTGVSGRDVVPQEGAAICLKISLCSWQQIAHCTPTISNEPHLARFSGK